MKLILPTYILLFLCIFMPRAVLAQSELDQATAMLLKVKNAYDSASMSFQLRYTYASADQPAVITDSLIGDARLCGISSYMSLGSIIFFRNQSLNISVFKDDKLIMVSKPSVLSNDMQMPADYLATALKGTGVNKCSIKRSKHNTIISMGFSDAAACQYMEVVIDEKQLLILSMTVKIKKPADPDAKEPLSGEAQYAIVKTDFKGFKAEPRDLTVFNEHMFFTRKGDVFKPAPMYADYQVFLASPNI